MRAKNFIIPVILAGFILSTISMHASALPINKQEKKGQESEIVIIPDKVKAIFKEGVSTRQARLDIPFSIIWNIFLPARQNMHSVFYFKVKNADLGFIPVPQAQEAVETKKEEKAKTPALYQTSGHVFLQFNRLENNTVQEVAREVYIPLNLQAEGKSYDPEKEEFYSTGYPLPPGDYLLAMAIASLDLEKIGTQYYEFSLPSALSFTEELGTTPVFFIKDIKRMQAAETRAEVHKEFFTYSVLQITPNIGNIFSVGENLDIFFFIFGTAPNEEGKHDIEINYEVLKGEETAIRYAKAHYENPLVSQPLPMKKTVIVKTEKEGEKVEKKEQRDLEPGQYTLQINIKDNVTGKSAKKSVAFEVK